jgi:plasmid stability protein
MPGLLIKNVPPEVHRRLKLAAQRSRRSMTSQALVLLEDALRNDTTVKEPPAPIRVSIPITKAFVDRAKRFGRA